MPLLPGFRRGAGAEMEWRGFGVGCARCMRPARSPAPAVCRAGMRDGGRGRDREPVGIVRCMDRPTGLPRHDDFTAVQTLWRSGFPPACRIVSRTLPGRLRGVSTGSKAGQRGSPMDLHACSTLPRRYPECGPFRPHSTTGRSFIRAGRYTARTRGIAPTATPPDAPEAPPSFAVR